MKKTKPATQALKSLRCVTQPEPYQWHTYTKIGELFQQWRRLPDTVDVAENRPQSAPLDLLLPPF